MVNPTIVSQDKLRKTEAMKLPVKPLDSIQLKPPAGGGTSPEILYNDEQIKAIINEALGYYQKEFTSEQIIILVKNKYNLSLITKKHVWTPHGHMICSLLLAKHMAVLTWQRQYY